METWLEWSMPSQRYPMRDYIGSGPIGKGGLALFDSSLKGNAHFFRFLYANLFAVVCSLCIKRRIPSIQNVNSNGMIHKCAGVCFLS